MKNAHGPPQKMVYPNFCGMDYEYGWPIGYPKSLVICKSIINKLDTPKLIDFLLAMA